MREFYAGISSHRIQDWLNNNQQHFKMKPVFLNKDELKLSAKAPMERLQIDLVDFSSAKSHHNRKQYSYVLAVLDVFSRFLILRQLVKKEAVEIVPHLVDIFNLFGRPLYVQTDQ